MDGKGSEAVGEQGPEFDLDEFGAMWLGADHQLGLHVVGLVALTILAHHGFVREHLVRGVAIETDHVRAAEEHGALRMTGAGESGELCVVLERHALLELLQYLVHVAVCAAILGHGHGPEGEHLVALVLAVDALLSLHVAVAQPVTGSVGREIELELKHVSHLTRVVDSHGEAGEHPTINLDGQHFNDFFLLLG